METETTPTHRPNLSGVLSDSERILTGTANYTHFIALSLLFLPLSISLITTPIIFSYILIVYLLSMCAIATITYSTHHAFSGKPVNLLATIKSLTTTFFPIVTTAILSHSLLVLISLSLLLFVRTNLMLVHNYLGIFVIDHNSIYFTWLSAVIIIVLVTYFHVNWSLAFVVVVVESKWGLEALIRSSYLVKGTRSVSLLLCLYFGNFVAISVWVLSDGVRALSGPGYVLFAITFGSIWLMSFLRHITVATTVLYNYCKAFHGELVIYGFDEKVHHVVEA